MRRTLTLFILLTISVVYAGCSANDQGNASNAPGTTTYSNANAAPATSNPSTSAPASGGGDAGGAPKTSPTAAPGIKPPTSK